MSNSNVNKPDLKQTDRPKNIEKTVELTDLETKKDPKGGISIPGVGGSKSSYNS